MTEPEIVFAAPLHYTVSAEDALVYERLPREFRGAQTVLFYVWMGLAGFPLAALPESIAGPFFGWRFALCGAALLAVQYLIYRVVRDLLRRNRARFRYPKPVAATLQQAEDHLVVTEAGKRRTIPFTGISMLLPGPTHLFIAVGQDLVIVPASAFGEGEAGQDAMLALTGTIDSFMADRYAAEAETDDDPLDDEALPG